MMEIESSKSLLVREKFLIASIGMDVDDRRGPRCRRPMLEMRKDDGGGRRQVVGEGSISSARPRNDRCPKVNGEGNT